MAMINDLQILIPTATQEILNLLINQCKTFAIDYCNLDEYEESLDEVVKMMVCERFNKLSADGISSQSYSGVSESYTNDFSPMIYKSLRRHRRVTTMRSNDV